MYSLVIIIFIVFFSPYAKAIRPSEAPAPSTVLLNNVKLVAKQRSDEIAKMSLIPSLNIIKDLNRKYNNVGAEYRITKWIDIIKNPKNKSLADMDKLNLVNDFFNKIPYSSDDLTWKREDYWATPIESLSRNASDCEDYAIAKYLTLRKLGMPEDKLRITIVHYVQQDKNHMLLVYRADKQSRPLILDNVNKEIQKISEMNGYIVKYAFNNSAVWSAKQRSGKWEEKLISNEKLDLWKGLTERLKDGQ